MKKIITVIILSILTLTFIPTQAMADVSKGQKIFKKKMRKYCKISGVRFAREHSQDEWEELWEEGYFQKETKKICPNLDLKSIKKSWWKDLYDFTYEFGTGGSHVPKC